MNTFKTLTTTEDLTVLTHGHTTAFVASVALSRDAKGAIKPEYDQEELRDAECIEVQPGDFVKAFDALRKRYKQLTGT